MRRKNLKLIGALIKRRMTQAELVREANLSSEARLSRIISYYVEPTREEITKITKVLKMKAQDLEL